MLLVRRVSNEGPLFARRGRPESTRSGHPGLRGVCRIWADSDLWPNGRKAPGSGRTSVARERAESARSVSSLSLLNVRHILGRSATIAQRVGLHEEERCVYGWLGAP